MDTAKGGSSRSVPDVDKSLFFLRERAVEANVTNLVFVWGRWGPS